MKQIFHYDEMVKMCEETDHLYYPIKDAVAYDFFELAKGRDSFVIYIPGKRRDKGLLEGVFKVELLENGLDFRGSGERADLIRIFDVLLYAEGKMHLVLEREIKEEDFRALMQEVKRA